MLLSTEVYLYIGGCIARVVLGKVKKTQLTKSIYTFEFEEGEQHGKQALCMFVSTYKIVCLIIDMCICTPYILYLHIIYTYTIVCLIIDMYIFTPHIL